MYYQRTTHDSKIPFNSTRYTTFLMLGFEHKPYHLFIEAQTSFLQSEDEKILHCTNKLDWVARCIVYINRRWGQFDAAQYSHYNFAKYECTSSIWAYQPRTQCNQADLSLVSENRLEFVWTVMNIAYRVPCHSNHNIRYSLCARYFNEFQRKWGVRRATLFGDPIDSRICNNLHNSGNEWKPKWPQPDSSVVGNLNCKCISIDLLGLGRSHDSLGARSPLIIHEFL